MVNVVRSEDSPLGNIGEKESGLLGDSEAGVDTLLRVLEMVVNFVGDFERLVALLRVHGRLTRGIRRSYKLFEVLNNISWTAEMACATLKAPL